MKKITVSLFVSSLILIIGCSSGGGWGSKMRKASKILSELIPKVVLDKWENDKEEQEKLKALTLQLSGISHGINSETGVPSLDPTVKFVSREFKKELTMAQTNMNQNRWADAQAQIKKATQYCVACHAMTSGDSSSFSLQLSPDLSDFSDYEKAVYFSAVRQFELSIFHYEKALSDKAWSQKNPELWNVAVQNMMAVVGRIKRDPDLIMDLVSQFFEIKAYPKDLRRAALQWKKDARQWRESKSARINLEISFKYFSAANRSEAKVKGSGLINYLRASSNLNELLRVGAVSDYNYQRSFYLAGQLAEALGERNFYGFADDYYQLCVDRAKDSRTGKLCARALKKGKS